MTPLDRDREEDEMARQFYLEGERLRRLAADPATTPEQLRELAEVIPHNVRLVVAANPNTPFETLVDLALGYPVVVSQNSSFIRDFTANPARLDAAPESLREALARYATDPGLLSGLTRFDCEYTGVELAQNPALPRSAAIYLTGSSYSPTRTCAITHPAVPRRWLKLLKKFHLLARLSTFVLLTEGIMPPEDPPIPEPSEAELEDLWKGGPVHREFVAYYTRSESQISRILENEDQEAWVVLAFNPALSTEASARLAELISPDWFEYVAWRTPHPTILWAVLSKGDTHSLTLLLSNPHVAPHTSRNALERLLPEAPPPPEEVLLSVAGRMDWLRRHSPQPIEGPSEISFEERKDLEEFYATNL